MELVIEKKAIPVTEKKGDRRMNTIIPALEALIKANDAGGDSSVLIPMKNAADERKHFVFRAGKYGRSFSKDKEAKFIVLAEQDGLRFWLNSLDEKSEDKVEQKADEAPEVKA